MLLCLLSRSARAWASKQHAVQLLLEPVRLSDNAAEEQA
jgi:hypothetical protein